MQNIRSKYTLPERKIAKELKLRKVYFSQHSNKILGKPDFIFRRKKVLVFIDSDFWHMHPKRFVMPKSNINYWKPKLKRNKKRDSEVNKSLTKDGWKVIRIWEYDVLNNLSRTVNKILKILSVS